jgi:flagellar biosynthesis protein FliQ
MNDQLGGALLREGFLVLGTVGTPFVVVLLVVGVVFGMLQSATQINDAAVSFLPRLLAGLGMTWLAGSWAMDHLAKYLIFAFQRMTQH